MNIAQIIYPGLKLSYGLAADATDADVIAALDAYADDYIVGGRAAVTPDVREAILAHHAAA